MESKQRGDISRKGRKKREGNVCACLRIKIVKLNACMYWRKGVIVREENREGRTEREERGRAAHSII